MCDPIGYTPPPKCRTKQLYNAGERVIDCARITSGLKVSQDFKDLADLQKWLGDLKEAIATFDRLNRGL